MRIGTCQNHSRKIEKTVNEMPPYYQSIVCNSIESPPSNCMQTKAFDEFFLLQHPMRSNVTFFQLTMLNEGANSKKVKELKKSYRELYICSVLRM